MIDRYTGSL